MEVVCIGLATLDTILEVPVYPAADSRVVASARVVCGGGPAATAAVALARLGVPVAFVGAVGDDDVGAKIRGDLELEGVDVSAVAVVPDAHSPQSTILVERGSGARTIVHHPGTLPRLELDAAASELVGAAEWIHADQVGFATAYRFLTERRCGRRSVKTARLSVDGGNPIDGLDLAGVALYAPTESALRDAFGTAEAALAAGAETVVVTRGAEGSYAVTRDGRVDAPGLPPTETVSTLGAGDVFHGALLARLVRGDSLEDALRGANGAASLSCRALDGRSAIPTLDELERSFA